MVFVRNVNSRDGGPALASKPSKHAVPQPSQTGAILERLNSRVQKSSSPRSLSLWQTLKIIHPTACKYAMKNVRSFHSILNLNNLRILLWSVWIDWKNPLFTKYLIFVQVHLDLQNYWRKLLLLIIINNIVNKKYSIRDFVSIKRSVLSNLITWISHVTHCR